MRTRMIVTVAAALAAVAATVPADAAPAKAPTVSDPIAEGLAGPLQLSVNRHGIAFSQSFAGTVSKLRPNGSVKNLATEPGGENADVSGVLLTRRGVAYNYTNFARGVAKLKFVTNDGKKSTLADLRAIEEDRNPDKGTSYGFKNISPSCEADWDAFDADPNTPDQQGLGPATYTGIVDAHPYAIAKAPGGWYVADAGGNDILQVSRSGKVRPVAVFGTQPALLTQEAADAGAFPDCVVGKRYRFESVPTDVEVLPDGNLVVSLLPGGPEDPSLGARGKVVRVNPTTGRIRTLAEGLAGGTNVAVTDNGNRIFATNLFGGFITKLSIGGSKPYAEVNQPAALEWYDGKLYVGYDVFGPSGKISVLE